MPSSSSPRPYGRILPRAISIGRSMNIAGASGGTVPGSARAEPARLGQRVVSAWALAPVPIAGVGFGRPWLPLVTAVAAAVMAWEWGRLCQRSRPGAATTVLLRIVLVAVVMAPIATAAAADAGLAVAA